MEFLVLDEQFREIAVVDTFDSLIWTDRLYECGDFELYTLATDFLIQNLRPNYYLWTKESEHMMIIEDITIDSDVDSGSHLKVTGRSLESILDRRIVWDDTYYDGSLQNGIKMLIENNITKPTITSRKISNFVFKESTDKKVCKLHMTGQWKGETLYEVISEKCKVHNIGFRVTLNDENQFVFELFAGTDFSYEQDTNPYVVFSPEFDNIYNSNYLESVKDRKTVSKVFGAEPTDEEKKEGYVRWDTIVGGNELTGLDRREMSVDASGIARKEGEVELTKAQYIARLQNEGAEKLAEKKIVKTFEGEVETTNMFIYNKDYFVGDIVQIVNEYGFESRVMVTEAVRSQDSEGFKLIPTFVKIVEGLYPSEVLYPSETLYPSAR